MNRTQSPPSAARRARRAPERLEWIEAAPPAVLLVAALLLGGSDEPLGDMILELLGIGLVALLAIRFTRDEWRRSRIGWYAVLAALIVAAIELMPIPFALWSGLPGRALPAAILRDIGAAGGARGISLDPDATAATLIQLVPGLAAFIATLAAARAARRVWGTIIAAAACLCALLGGLQVAGRQDLYLYAHSDAGTLTGLFANHNHASDLLLIGIALLASRLPGAPRARPAIAGLIGLLAVAVLLTTSRVGIVLLAAEACALVLALGGVRSRTGRRVTMLAGTLCAVALVLLVAAPGVDHAFGRFAALPEDSRGGIWSTTLFAIGRYWPVGSGLGTFVPVYAAVEPLDTLSAAIVNHAHCEYLELVLELGLAGALLVVGYLALLVLAVVRGARRQGGADTWAATIGVAILLIHSAFEFPLRDESLLVVFGILNGIVFAALQQDLMRRSPSSVSR